MKHTSYQHLEALAYNEGVHLDIDREENMATAVVWGIEYYAVIPPAVDGGVAISWEVPS